MSMNAEDSGGPVSFITGGTSGIGAALARRLLAAGHRIVITGRDTEQLAGTAADLKQAISGSAVLALPGDATDFGDVSTAVDATVGRFGRLDVAVANAGLSTFDSLAEGDPDSWRAMILTNVLGPALLIRAVLPALKETQGRIVLMGSVAGVKNTSGNLYSVTKWAVTALAENTRMMVTGDGVGVTLIAPGKVDTPFWGAEGATGPALSAESIADTILWVLSQPAGVDVNTVVMRPLGQPI